MTRTFDLVVALAAAVAAFGCTKTPAPRDEAPTDPQPAGSASVPPPPPAEVAAEAAPAPAPGPEPERFDPPEYEVVDPIPTDPVLDMLLESLEGDDDEMRSVAVESAASVGGEDLTAWCVAHMKAVNENGRAALLAVLGQNADFAGLTTALTAMRDPDESVRVAAIKAAAAIGKEMVVQPLVEALGRASRGERAAARTALTRLPTEDASLAIAEALPDAAPAVRVVLLEVLAERNATACIDAVRAAAADADARVRRAAIRALSRLGGMSEFEMLLARVAGGATGAEARAMERAISRIGARVENADTCADAILKAFESATGKPRLTAIRMLGRLGSPRGLADVREAIASSEAAVRDAGVRALSDWPDATVADELLSVARGEFSLAYRVLALRAYVRVLGLPSGRDPGETLRMLRTTLSIAEEWKRPAEIKLVISGLGFVGDPGALEVLLPMLAREELAAEAAAAVIAVAGRVRGAHEDAALSALRKVVASGVDHALKARARTAIAGGATD